MTFKLLRNGWLAGCAISSLAFVAEAKQGVQLPAPTDSGPSLPATMAFIVEKIGAYDGHDVHDADDEIEITIRDISVSPSKCVLRYTNHWEHRSASGRILLPNEYQSTLDFSADMVPPYISQPDDATGFHVDGLPVNDRDTAERILRADEHARQLCKGSHQEPF